MMIRYKNANRCKINEIKKLIKVNRQYLSFCFPPDLLTV